MRALGTSIAASSVLAVASLAFGCERNVRTPRPDAGFGQTLSEGPVETVPRAIGGGPPTGTVSRDDARTRISAARCRVAASCGTAIAEATSSGDGADACITRMASALTLSCDEIEAARLDLCLAAIGGCEQGTLPPECASTSLCP